MKKLTALTLMSLIAFLPALQAEESDEAKVTAKMKEAYAAAEKKDEGELKRIAEGLKLPQPDVWFASQFGDEKGAKIASSYMDMNVDTAFPGLILQIAGKGQSNVQVTAIAGKDDPNAVGNQKDALTEMKNPLTLYSVRFIKPGDEKGFHLYSLAVIDGQVRFLGKMN